MAVQLKKLIANISIQAFSLLLAEQERLFEAEGAKPTFGRIVTRALIDGLAIGNGNETKAQTKPQRAGRRKRPTA